MKILTTLALITAIHFTARAAEPDKDGWQTLFDGKTLTGWHVSTKTGHRVVRTEFRRMLAPRRRRLPPVEHFITFTSVLGRGLPYIRTSVQRCELDARQVASRLMTPVS